MLGAKLLQALFAFIATLFFFFGGVTEANAIIMVGFYFIAVLLEIVIELKKFNKKNEI